jgi:hypothetical protein
MDKNVRATIGWWKNLGSDQADPFMKFFMFYVCLDAWMTTSSGANSDRRKLAWLITTDNPLKEHWATIATGQKFRSWLNGLAKIGTVKDMTPGSHDYKKLNDIADFEQVILFIYQIRCNLFHGGKSPVNKNDRRLVSLSAKILERWIEWAYIKTRDQ